MNKKIGFIGCGKMANAMIEGILRSNLISPDNIKVSARTEETLKKIKSIYKINTTLQNGEVAEFADIVILAVKPDLYSSVINEIKTKVKEDAVIVTIAAGISLNDVENFFGRNVKAVRTMPNTPSFAGEGMSALCPNASITEEDIARIERVFNSFGKTEILEEKLMDAVPAISGSSPAYVYMMIEAMADGGVRLGVPRDKAYRLAAQAVMGAAKMVLESGEHPGALKDNVCTPGGATIEAVVTLEQHHFRGTVLAAMESCYEKTKALSNPKK